MEMFCYKCGMPDAMCICNILAAKPEPSTTEE